MIHTRRAYLSLTTGEGSSSFAFAKGETATISGELVVDEIAPTSEYLVTAEDRPGLIVWRVRRGKQSQFDKRLGSEGDWMTNEAGIIAGELRIDNGHQEIRIDPEWIVTRHRNKNVTSLTESDLKGRGPWSSQAWESPYVYLNRHQHSYQLNEDDVLPREVRSRLSGELDRYQLEVKFLPEGVKTVAHGKLDIEDGVPVLRGSNDQPMVISDHSDVELYEYLRFRALKAGLYASVLFVVAVIFFIWSESHLLIESIILR